MKKKMNHCIIAAFLLAQLVAPLAHGHGDGAAGQGPVDLNDITLSLQDPGTGQVREVPLFAQSQAETPVAMVNGEPILLAELVGEVLSLHGDPTEAAAGPQQDYQTLLNRLIAIRLANQEAANIGLDQLPAVRKELDDFALATLIKTLIRNQINDLTPDEKEVEELYRQMALEAKLTTYTLTTEAAATELLAQHAAGQDFDTLAAALVKAGQASGGMEADYLKLRDMLPNVAAAVFAMEPGTVSEVFKADKGYLVFRLDDRRAYDDPEARVEAAAMVRQRAASLRRDAYLKELEEKYAVFDEEAAAALDFAAIVAARPEATATEIFAELTTDQRPLVTITDTDFVAMITVAEIAQQLEKALYHGTDRTINPQKMATKKVSILHDKLVRIIGGLEARKEGIHQTVAYQETIRKHRERLVFDTFISKAVLPGITVKDEEARAYYQENSAEYSTPLMLKLKALAFNDEQSALDALVKLRAGSDFKWVSANAAGLAPADDKNLLAFAGTLLSVTALPEGLRAKAAKVGTGDALFYEGPGQIYYVLLVERAFPPEAKPYEQVRNEAAKVVYARKIREALDAWVASLKDAYHTEVFLVAKKS